jgi:hypothetical protein
MESLISIVLFIGFLYFMMRFGCGARGAGHACGHSSHGRHETGRRSRTSARSISQTGNHTTISVAPRKTA